MLKEWIARFPLLVSLRWFFSALRNSAFPLKSYAQNGEDTIVLGQFAGADLRRGWYIDVGANHPTKLSNTYALYRAGMRGVVIEPNRAFHWLYRLFRPRDRFINIGIARTGALLPFYHHLWAVLSGFGEQSAAEARRVEYLPVLPLDAVIPSLEGGPVWVLSIDVEGLNFEVLQSGTALLEKTVILVIEYGEEEREITDYLTARGFRTVARTPHNLILRGASPPPSAATTSVVL